MGRIENKIRLLLMVVAPAIFAFALPAYAERARAGEEALLDKLKELSPPAEPESSLPTPTETPTPFGATSDTKAPKSVETGDYAKVANIISSTQGIDPTVAAELIKLASKKNAEAAEEEEESKAPRKRRPSSKASDDRNAIVNSIAEYLSGNSKSSRESGTGESAKPVAGAATSSGNSSPASESLTETQNRLLENVRLQKPKYAAPQPGALDINSVAAGRFAEPLYATQAKASALPAAVFLDAPPAVTQPDAPEPVAPQFPTHQRK